ncbi:MAG: ATP-binding protein, partial [Mycobacteriales bacterium]
LLENATGYSSPRTKVLVSSRMVGPNLMVEIEDQGIGMAPVMLSAINERLSRPPTATDVDVSKHMGLYVVSQLAARHRIKVQLRASPLGGVIAMILIPAACLRPQGDFQQGGDPQGYGQQQAQPAGAGQGFAQPRALTAQPTATPPPPRMPAPSQRQALDRQPYASGSTPPVQFNTGSFPPAPTQYNTGSTPPVQYNTGSFPPAQYNTGSVPPAQYNTGSTPPVPYGGGSNPPAQYNTGSTPPVPYFPTPPPPAAAQRPAAPPPPLAPTAGFRLDGPGSMLLGGGPGGPGWQDENGGEQPPIYATIESEWFRDNSNRQQQPQQANGPESAPAGPPAPQQQPAGPGDGGVAQVSPYAAPMWTTPADSGWQAAGGAARPQPAGVTAAGLPRRDPMAQLVPGAAEPPSPPAPDWNNNAADRHQAAQATRSLLSSYRDGIERGRAEGRNNP